MCGLRFFAGPIIKKFGPLGLLSICTALAIVGLLWLSTAQGLILIFAAATLYAIGKTFFWPTILGVTAEQFPKGGALTLNAIAGIGMLTVGILGGPWIGTQIAKSTQAEIEKEIPGVYETISKPDAFILGNYQAIDSEKLAALPKEEMEKVEHIAKPAEQKALARIAKLPMFMLVAFLALAFYFKSKGGYKPVAIADH